MKNEPNDSIKTTLWWILWLTILSAVATIPAFIGAPFSINFFDEPYQILNALDWRNSVYSPLSAWLGHIYGELFHWKYLAFRWLLICLITLSIYITSLYSLIISNNKSLIIFISIFCVYFATTFKSDMNIYGWDHWSAPMVAINLVIMLSFLKRNTLWKIVMLGIFSSITVYMRLPNANLIGIITIIITLNAIKENSWKKFFIYETLYLIVALAGCLLVIFILYGSWSNYIEYFDSNKIGAHSVVQIIKPFAISSLAIIRYTLIMLLAYYVVWFASKKIHYTWLKYFVYAITGCGLFILMIPLRRNTMGNTLDAAISFALLGIILLISRGIKEKNKNEVLYAVSIFMICCVVSIGSNWGFFKFLAWPAVPLLAVFAIKKLTQPVKWYSILVGASFYVYSFFSFSRPTFFDDNLYQLNHKLSGGVLEGMYTKPERGKMIEEVERATKPFKQAGYQILSLKSGNEYIWEYINLNRNPYQRHNFDYWDAFNDSIYVEKVINHTKSTDNPVAILYLETDTLHLKDVKTPTFMNKRLDNELKKAHQGNRFIIYVNK